MQAIPPTDAERYIELEGSRASFVDDKTVFVILRDGTVHPIEIIAEGKTVTRLVMAPPLAQTTVPTVVRKLSNELLFVGSTAGPSVLLKAAKVEEEIDEDQDMDASPAVVETDDAMDFDDDDGEFRQFLTFRKKP